MPETSRGIEAQATLHHAYYLGLQLMVASTQGAKIAGDWTFRLFRQQHEQYFLASFNKLGLSGLPDAVACARYHVVSNSIGGVPVEYAEESDRKAWVRFRYPRWMFSGPTICGLPVEVGRGFLNGWYAHNGVSLNNPNLGFVCVSEDTTGEFGFFGYFKEYDHPLKDDERLQFARGELPPPFDPQSQPSVPSAQWSADRLAKANRNYAVAFIRNGISALVETIGREAALDIGKKSARLIGLQYFHEMAQLLNMPDGDYEDTAKFFVEMFSAMGDKVDMHTDRRSRVATIHQSGLQVANGLHNHQRKDFLTCWSELYLGMAHSHRIFKDVAVEISDQKLVWAISDR